MNKFFFCCLLVGLLGPFSHLAVGQQFYRFRADISVKDKLADGKYRLTMGKVYYDKIYKKIVYKLIFPKKEDMIVQDTSMFKVENGKLIGRQRTFLMPDFTVFHLALTGKLSDYGLTADESARTMYKIGKVEKRTDDVLTTWIPADDKLKAVLGNIQMLKKNRRLDAMIFYDKNGRMISRQFFKKYTNVRGLEFPGEITMLSYGAKGEKNIQQTTYKNIVIDQPDEDETYRYRIPVSKSAMLKK